MKQTFKKFFAVAALLCVSAVSARVAPYVEFRSDSADVPRKLEGTTSHHVWLYDMESFYGTFNVTAEYRRSFKPSKLASCLFGEALTTTTSSSCDSDCDSRSIKIQGSQLANRDSNALMAENFLLPRDFNGTVSFEPRVQKFLVDFHFYMSLDEWVKGLYFRVYGPFVHSSYDLDVKETDPVVGTNGYEAGYFSTATVPVANLFSKATDFFYGDKAFTDPNGSVTVQKLANAKWRCDKDTENCFGDLRGELGWNFLLEEDYHLGVAVLAAAPTGDRPNGEYLFGAQCGNGKHWEFGGAVHGHYTMWRSEDEEKHFDFIVEADITHMFKAKQKRTFDLKSGSTAKPLSRYMLAEKMTSTISNGLVGGGTAPNAQFAAEYAPVANFSTRDIKVDRSIQGDVALMFNYTSRGFSWDLGYNFWGVSCEDIELRCDCDGDFPENTWALKGDASTYGFLAEDSAPLETGDAVALSATDNSATAFAGSNGQAANRLTNPSIDNPQDASANPGGGLQDLNAGTAGGDRIKTSVQPVFIKQDDLDITGAQTRGISHKIFTHFSYTWIDREDWIPYIGVGFSAEFGRTEGKDCDDNSCSSSCDDSCSDCLDCALSQWGVWVKGGVSFN